MIDCIDKYQIIVCGVDCYCIVFVGCFYCYFVVKLIVFSNGFQGVYDVDYFIEVVVINKVQF